MSSRVASSQMIRRTAESARSLTVCQSSPRFRATADTDILSTTSRWRIQRLHRPVTFDWAGVGPRCHWHFETPRTADLLFVSRRGHSNLSQDRGISSATTKRDGAVPMPLAATAIRMPDTPRREWLAIP